MALPPAVEAGGNVLGAWIKQYGFATVVAAALVAFLVYQSIVTDQRQADSLNRVYELQTLNRTAALDIQARLGEVARTQAELTRTQSEMARSQADMARSMADLARALERLSDRLTPAVRAGTQ